MVLKRLTVLILCFCLLSIPVRAEENNKLIALTFDDGPSGRFTRKLLDGLEERDVKATFLLCGYRMEIYPELTERIRSEGHEIGLHGYSHCSMDKMSRRELDEEIVKTLALIPQGCAVKFLRPPGGCGDEKTAAAAADWGMSVLYWSVDPKDWAVKDAAVITRRVLREVEDGDVILLHDMSDSSVKAALAIVDALQKEGYRFVTVSELAAEKGIIPQPGEEYYHFR